MNPPKQTGVPKWPRVFYSKSITGTAIGWDWWIKPDYTSDVVTKEYLALEECEHLLREARAEAFEEAAEVICCGGESAIRGELLDMAKAAREGGTSD